MRMSCVRYARETEGTMIFIPRERNLAEHFLSGEYVAGGCFTTTHPMWRVVVSAVRQAMRDYSVSSYQYQPHWNGEKFATPTYHREQMMDMIPAIVDLAVVDRGEADEWGNNIFVTLQYSTAGAWAVYGGHFDGHGTERGIKWSIYCD